MLGVTEAKSWTGCQVSDGFTIFYEVVSFSGIPTVVHTHQNMKSSNPCVNRGYLLGTQRKGMERNHHLGVEGLVEICLRKQG